MTHVSQDNSPQPVKVQLTIPNKPELVEALGRLAMGHAHLEVVLKYTFKTLSRLSIREALDQMKKKRTAFVRKRIRRLFLEKNPEPEDIAQLEELLNEAKKLSGKRNDLLHSAWSESPAGQPIIKSEDHTWGLAPSKEEVDRITSEIVNLGNQINHERLHGFIQRVASKQLPEHATASESQLRSVMRSFSE
jgi:hypothetical protein